MSAPTAAVNDIVSFILREVEPLFGRPRAEVTKLMTVKICYAFPDADDATMRAALEMAISELLDRTAPTGTA